jgi:hypothetical protein
MNVYENESRLLFARERADLLASEMRAVRRPANGPDAGSRMRGMFSATTRLVSRRRPSLTYG